MNTYVKEYTSFMTDIRHKSLNTVESYKRDVTQYISYLDGSKVYFKNGGWVIARFSGTEPLLRIFCEMPDAADAAHICEIYEKFLDLKR